jgi:hypothetical protein
MLLTVNAFIFSLINGGHEFSEIIVSSSQISVFSSDYDVSSSQGDVGSSNDGADSSVGDVYMHCVVHSWAPYSLKR